MEVKIVYKFFCHDINKFLMLLRKYAYSYEHIDDSEKINEISFLEKDDIDSDINMEDITDADYTHAKGVCKDF